MAETKVNPDDPDAVEVREVRKALGLSRVKFGAAIGVTERAVQYWESGERRPPRSALFMMRRLRDERGGG